MTHKPMYNYGDEEFEFLHGIPAGSWIAFEGPVKTWTICLVVRHNGTNALLTRLDTGKTFEADSDRLVRWVPDLRVPVRT